VTRTVSAFEAIQSMPPGEKRQELRYVALCDLLNERGQDESMHGGQLASLVEKLADECGCGPGQGRSDGGAHFVTGVELRYDWMCFLRHEDHEAPTVMYLRYRNPGYGYSGGPFCWRLYR
jgi:hypothetical protein